MALKTNYAQGEADDIAGDDGLLDVASLCRMFEASEEATQEARLNAERDRDYVDNIQHTAEEIAALEKRGQPVVTDNRIKTKIDFLVGLEKQQRIDPRALPRTPAHEADADGATQALRYVAQAESHDQKRSGVWRNLLVEGAGGIRVYVEPSRKNYGGMNHAGMNEGQLSAMGHPVEYEIKISRIAWDRMFWDPHSSETDFSDAGYLGIVIWMDYADALAKYPDGQEALDTTMSSATHSDTYDDKPKWTSWADKKRKRVRIVQMWIKRDEQWYFAEFTKGGILKAGPSPYKTDKGESDCELFFQSAFVDRENNRYGYVREMISPQDEINKRRSKTLHALNTKQLFFVQGALSDVENARKQVAKPDGAIEVNLVAQGGLRDQIEVSSNSEVSEGNYKLLLEAQNAIDLKGPNATMLGDKAGGSASASGKAIIASQQGGMISLGDLLDNLRHLDNRVFTAMWNRIRQYWTAEKWVRTTDDERNVKWVAMNVDRGQMEMLAQQNPEAAERVAGVVSNVAELDCDIIIDQAPDNLTPQLEQFQALVELKKMDANGEIPFRAIVEAIPNLKNRQQFLEHMDEAQQAAQQQGPPPDPAMLKVQADAQAAAQKAQIDAKLSKAKQDADALLKERELEMRAAAEQRQLELEEQTAQRKLEMEERAMMAKAGRENDIARRRADLDEEMSLRKMALELVKCQNDEKAKAEEKAEEKDDEPDLAKATLAMQQAITEMAGTLAADVDLVRDANGRAAGMRRVRKQQMA